MTHCNPNKTLAGDMLAFAVVLTVAVAFLCLATWTFCWSFFIPFHFRYLAGVTITALAVKWMFFNRK